jgi:ABC-2 type transport system ATP-binding protein
MDKETYLDRWRRLRLKVPRGVESPPLPGIVGVRREGRLAVAISNAFVPDLAHAYENTGARVQSIENMTLEEIFVANVARRVERECHAIRVSVRTDQKRQTESVTVGPSISLS